MSYPTSKHGVARTTTAALATLLVVPAAILTISPLIHGIKIAAHALFATL